MMESNTNNAREEQSVRMSLNRKEFEMHFFLFGCRLTDFKLSSFVAWNIVLSDFQLQLIFCLIENVSVWNLVAF